MNKQLLTLAAASILAWCGQTKYPEKLPYTGVDEDLATLLRQMPDTTIIQNGDVTKTLKISWGEYIQRTTEIWNNVIQDHSITVDVETSTYSALWQTCSGKYNKLLKDPTSEIKEVLKKSTK